MKQPTGSPLNRHRHVAYSLIFACAPMATPALAADNFLNLPLEDLLKVEISSASRKIQQVQEVAAAVFVISREDIERSGARTIPEALRLAPGVEVARIANNRWAVSVRGFNGRFANKLLVLKDGRSIYSPLFSGVIWEAEDIILGDVERIEVIRGPGAAMWGSNAVNGVINIISRHTADTQGSEIIASTATDEPGSLSVRHGLKVGDGYLRISAKAFHVEPSRVASGDKGNDDWTATRFGLRGDWPAAGGGNWILVGEGYRSLSHDRLNLARYNTVPPQLDVTETSSGLNFLLRREKPMSDGGQMEWQLYAESSFLNEQPFIREARQTMAGDFQRRTPLGNHDLIYGASYRYSHDRIQLVSEGILESALFDRQQRDWQVASVFVNDEYTLIPDRLRLSAGVRIDHDNWSGTQAQPNIRLAWTPDARTTWWTALGRAARTPSRLEMDVPFSLGETAAIPPFVPAIKSVREAPAIDALKAERVNSLDAGLRLRLSQQLSVDLAVFVSDYSRLVSLITQTPRPVSPALVLVPLTDNNDAKARTYGYEIATDWQAAANWKIQAHYSHLTLHSPLLSDPSAAVLQKQWEGSAPRHRASLRSSWTLANGDLLDLWLKHTSRLNNPEVPAYTALDLRYAHRLGKQAEITVVGQNLLNKRHLEFISDYLPNEHSLIGRSLMVRSTWRF